MKKQNIAIIGVIAFALAVAVGYALFSESLTIGGTATAKGDFDVEITSIGTPTCSGFSGTCDKETLTEISTDKNTLTVTVDKLEYPGAYVKIPVTVTNQGSITAILTSLEETGVPTDSSVKVLYPDLKRLEGQSINQGETQSFTIEVLWDENTTASAENVEFTIGLNYDQVTAEKVVLASF